VKEWRDQIPIYVTRPFGPKNFTGRVSLPAWRLMLLRELVTLNAVGWGIYGLVELAGKVVG
jgi:hypothetical protein